MASRILIPALALRPLLWGIAREIQIAAELRATLSAAFGVADSWHS